MFLQAFHRHKPIKGTHTHLAMVNNTKTQSGSYARCEIRSHLAIDFESKLVGWVFLQCFTVLWRYVSLHMSLLLCKLNTCCTHALGQDHPKLLLSLPIDKVKRTCKRSLGSLQGEVTTYLAHLSQSQAQQRNVISQQKLHQLSQPQVIESPSKFSFLFPCSLLRVPVPGIWIWERSWFLH